MEILIQQYKIIMETPLGQERHNQIQKFKRKYNEIAGPKQKTNRWDIVFQCFKKLASNSTLN